MAGDQVVADGVVAGIGRMLRGAAQVDAGLQHLRFVLFVDAAKALGALVAASGVEVQESIVRDGVTGADQKQPAKFHAVKSVAGDLDVLGVHAGVGVVHHDAEVAEGISRGRFAIDAGVIQKGAVVEAIEVETFPVDFREVVALIDGGIDVAGGVDPGRGSGVLDIDQLDRPADVGDGVVLDAHARGRADLDAVAPDGIDGVPGEDAVF